MPPMTSTRWLENPHRHASFPGGVDVFSRRVDVLVRAGALVSRGWTACAMTPLHGEDGRMSLASRDVDACVHLVDESDHRARVDWQASIKRVRLEASVDGAIHL